MNNDKSINATVANYYSDKIKAHGVGAVGVDWNSEESQFLRFDQLLKILEPDSQPFSILDFGCGYGALLQKLAEDERDYTYIGYDISEDMLTAGRSQNKDNAKASFTSCLSDDRSFDYVVASGVFNVRLDCHDGEWQEYLLETLRMFHKYSKKGFAFNLLTSYSDPEYMKDYLYYADPCYIFDFCKKNFSRSVAVLHDYPLYEFTVLVRYDEGDRK